MQDISTGALVPIDMSKLFTELPTKEFVPFESLTELQQQQAKDTAIPNRDHHGPVFTVGEVLNIKGGKFRVNGFSRKRLYLDSLPS